MEEIIEPQNTDRALTIIDQTPRECPKCQKQFKNAVALRMHDARVHTKTLNPNRRSKISLSREEKLAKRRAYSRIWRARRGMRVRPSLYYKTEPRTKKTKRIRYVYPEPGEPRGKQLAQPTYRRMAHCPYCGENIQRHLALETE
jgi:hypothetical protein